MQGEAAVKVGRPLVETQTCHRKMKSPFERNQNINARRSRSKMGSTFGRNPNLPQKNKIALWSKPKLATAKTSTKPLPK